MAYETAGYAAGSATSKAAAETLYDRDSIQYAVLNALYDHPLGLIVDEVKDVTEKVMKRTFERTTIGARVTELLANGMVRETDDVRKTPRGRNATVYKLTTKGRDWVLNN